MTQPSCLRPTSLLGAFEYLLLMRLLKLISQSGFALSSGGMVLSLFEYKHMGEERKSYYHGTVGVHAIYLVNNALIHAFKMAVFRLRLLNALNDSVCAFHLLPFYYKLNQSKIYSYLGKGQ